jgi:hypothetical protein
MMILLSCIYYSDMVFVVYVAIFDDMTEAVSGDVGIHDLNEYVSVVCRRPLFLSTFN